MKFRVIITETLRLEMEVEAEDKDAAEDKAWTMYEAEEVVLTADDWTETTIDVGPAPETEEN